LPLRIWSGHGGVQVSTKTAAKAKLREILRDHADGLTVASSTDTVEDVVRDWVT
jgi:hypothetical protein